MSKPEEQEIEQLIPPPDCCSEVKHYALHVLEIPFTDGLLFLMVCNLRLESVWTAYCLCTAFFGEVFIIQESSLLIRVGSIF